MSIFDKVKEKFNEYFPNDSDKKGLLPDDVSVLMQDGTKEEYSGLFQITDGENCMVCGGNYDYHTVMACPTIQNANRIGMTIKAMYISDALKEKRYLCSECERLSKEDDE